MSIEDDLRRVLRHPGAPQGWPDPVHRVETGIRRRLRRRRITIAAGLLALLVPAALLTPWAIGRPFGRGSTSPGMSPAPWLAESAMDSAWIAALAALLGLTFAFRPVKERAVDRFRQRYGVGAPGSATVRAYLGRRRRWLGLGATTALVVELLLSPPDGIQVRWAVLCLGLFGGALAAHLGPAPTSATPGQSRRVPGLLLTTTAGVAMLAAGAVLGIPRLGVITPPAATTWAVVALGIALATLVALPVVARRGRVDGSEAGRAIVTSSLHTVAAVGVATPLVCLSHALGIAGELLLNETAKAVAAIGWIPTVTAAALAYVLGRAGRRRDGLTIGQSPRLQAAAVSGLAALVFGGVLIPAVLADRPPFPPSAVNPRVTIVVADWEHHAEAAQLLGTTGTQPELMGNPEVIYGRFDVDVPENVTDQYRYHLLLFDEATNTATQHMAGLDYGGTGWGGTVSRAPLQYPWLSVLTGSQAGYAMARADTPGPKPFTALFPPEMPFSTDRLLAALILTGPDEQIYWAVRVPVTVLELPQ